MANPFKNLLKKVGINSNPSGNVVADQIQVKPVETISTTMMAAVPTSFDDVVLAEPYGTKVPQLVKGRSSGWSQIQNLSTNLDITKVQAALRQAERGDTTMYFGYIRDLTIGTGPTASELAKRKLATLSEPYSIIPADKHNEDDVHAAEVIQDMIYNCPNWNEALSHLLNSIIFPVAVTEKIFRPTNKDDNNPFGVRYYLKNLQSMDYTLINYRLPYLPTGPTNALLNLPAGTYGVPPYQPLIPTTTGEPENTIYDLDSWEPRIRFYRVFANGLIDYTWSSMYRPDPDRHIVYRSGLMQGVAPENFGDVGRSILFWSIMAQLGREFFLRCMDRYGIPFVVIKADTADKPTVDLLEQAFQLSNKLGALIVNKDAEVEIKEISMAGAADAHDKFIQLCNDQIALLITGITLGGHAKSTGLGSGVANLQSEVRQDIINYDRICLSAVLRNQLFKQYLEINGIKGNPPLISWGSTTAENIKDLSASIYNLYQAGVQPTDDALEVLSEKFGFAVERMSQPEPNGEQPAEQPKEETDVQSEDDETDRHADAGIKEAA